MAEFEVEFDLDLSNEIEATFELSVPPTYEFKDGLTEKNWVVTLNRASKEDFGGVVVGENIEVDENAVISILDATEENKGVIRIASDEDITKGTETRAAITPKQLAEHTSGMEEEIKALDEKVDGINANLNLRIDEVQKDVNEKYNDLLRDIDHLTDVVEEDFDKLNKKIDKETSDREQADIALGDRITELDQSLSKDIDDLDQKLSQEISDLDDKLSQDIEDEATAREQADSTLQGNIDILSETVQEHYTELTEDINSLVDTVNDNRVASENRDKALGERIDGLSQQEIADKEEILKAIQDEITARTAADITLDNKYAKAVSDEATAREQADTTLDNKITTETKKVDDRLTEVAEEINRSIEDHVVALEGDIENLENRVDTVEDNSIVKIDYNATDVGITVTYGDSETEDVLFTNIATNAKLQAVEAKVDANTQAISNEVANRTQADTTLQNNINNLSQAVTENYNTLNGKINDEATLREAADNSLQGAINTVDGKIDGEVTNREQADNDLQQQIDALVAGSDVKDIIGTYAELETYDTSKLGDKDIIKVLQDETRDNASTYYRYVAQTQSFTYIGKEGPYYTKSESDERYVPVTRTINGKSLNTDISLTYSDVNALPDDTFIPEKVTDLTDEANYVKFTDVASTSKTGVIKTSDDYATGVYNGALYANYKTLEQYKSADNGLFIGKATLEAIKDYLSDGKIIKKQGAPLPITEGTKGLLYEDVLNGDLYQCVEANSTYTWVRIANKNDLDELEARLTNNLINYDLTKVDEYLYSIHYNRSQLDYYYALDYFKNKYKEENSGKCSTVRKGNYFGRNYDWYYSECASFVVKKESARGKYASIGMAGGISALTKVFVDTNEWDDAYKVLPYLLSDGINEHGVVVSINVVPNGDKGKTTGTHSTLPGDEICMLMLPSYILDNFITAREAVEWIRDEAKIYAPDSEALQEEMHFMIADKNNTFVVEFVNNAAVITEDKKFMTNFYLDGVTFDSTGKVNFNSVTSYGQGLERYNIIAERYSELDSAPSILNLMRDLNYTNAYNASDLQKWWKTEFVAPYADKGRPYPNLTVTSPVELFQTSGLITAITDAYEERTRDGISTWQTIHSSVYDIENLQFLVVTQEQDLNKVKTFQLFPSIGDGELVLTKGNEILGKYSANQQLDTIIDLTQSIKPAWGDITGTLDNQVDLKNVLDTKITYVDLNKDVIIHVDIPSYIIKF